MAAKLLDKTIHVVHFRMRRRFFARSEVETIIGRMLRDKCKSARTSAVSKILLANVREEKKTHSIRFSLSLECSGTITTRLPPSLPSPPPLPPPSQLSINRAIAMTIDVVTIANMKNIKRRPTDEYQNDDRNYSTVTNEWYARW